MADSVSIFESWCQHQYLEAMAFAAQSDVLSLAPVAGTPPYKYIARFECRGLASTAEGITIADRHLVGILFPDDYLQTSCDPAQLLTWLEPVTEFQPNIRPPFCCIGHIPPGMSLMSILHQLYQMITWQRFTPREDDALNPEACSWARNNMDRLPIEARRSMLAGSANGQTDGATAHE